MTQLISFNCIQNEIISLYKYYNDAFYSQRHTTYGNICTHLIVHVRGLIVKIYSTYLSLLSIECIPSEGCLSIVSD